MSQGPNWLIQQGARPVTCGEDILADYWDQFPQKLAHAKALEPEHLRQRLERLQGAKGRAKAGASAGEVQGEAWSS